MEAFTVRGCRREQSRAQHIDDSPGQYRSDRITIIVSADSQRGEQGIEPKGIFLSRICSCNCQRSIKGPTLCVGILVMHHMILQCVYAENASTRTSIVWQEVFETTP